MIQDIWPKHLYNEYDNRLPEGEDYVLCFRQEGILVKQGSDSPFPRYREYCDFSLKQEVIYLFSIDKQSFFLAQEVTGFPVDTYSFLTMHEIRGHLEREWVLAAATGWHLYLWYRDNAFCGHCGKPTFPDDKQRMLRCSCGNMIFPRIAPAVIVAVTKGEQILLTRYANRTYTKYALIAGFTEIGETAEETVRREVMEEVGLKVKNIRYYKSQPWGFDSNLLLGFFCEVDGESEIVLDRQELAVAEWVDRSEVPDYGEGLSLTHEMMLLFRTGKR